MRIATWNILSGRHPDLPWQDASAFASSVQSLDADLLGLQEVDREQPRSGHADLTAIAAEAMSAVDWLFAPTLTGPPQQWRTADGSEAAGGPAYGVAFLSRYPVAAWDVIRLRGAPWPAPYLWKGNRMPSLVRDEPRVAIVADVETPGGPLRVVTTHLSFLPMWNGVQLRRLVRRLAGGPPPVLLGDLNMGPRRAERIAGMRPLASGPTFPAHAPTRQIDHVLAAGPLRASGGGPLRLPVSDHQALVADAII